MMILSKHATRDVQRWWRLVLLLPIVGIGIGWALAMGLVGGLLPAVRAARIPVTFPLCAL